jgi:serine O-acetyltransferase
MLVIAGLFPYCNSKASARSGIWKFYMNKFSADIARYKEKGSHGKDLWLNPAVWAIAIYRLGNWLHTANPFLLVRIPLKGVYFFAHMFSEVVMEMCLDPLATIDGGLYISHIGGVHINPQAIIGCNCDMTHGVTIGASAMGRQGAPVIGNNVYIGTGATLVGKIKVGDGAKISANTLVITNVPDGATMMGVPGRIIMRPPKAVQQPVLSATEKE